MHGKRPVLAAGLCLLAAMAVAAEPRTIGAPGMGNVNNDAMTVSGCRERLRQPKAARPKDDDPRVDLDAVCRNMLGSSAPPTVPKKKARPARAASAASR